MGAKFDGREFKARPYVTTDGVALIRRSFAARGKCEVSRLWALSIIEQWQDSPAPSPQQRATTCNRQWYGLRTD